MSYDQSGERGNPAKLEGLVEPDRQEAAQGLTAAWLRAVAIVWSDPAKLTQLRQDPRRFLRAECGYDPPASLGFTVHETREGGGSWRWGAQRATEAEVIIEVPPPPALSEQPVALAELASAFERVPLCAC